MHWCTISFNQTWMKQTKKKTLPLCNHCSRNQFNYNEITNWPGPDFLSAVAADLCRFVPPHNVLGACTRIHASNVCGLHVTGNPPQINAINRNDLIIRSDISPVNILTHTHTHIQGKLGNNALSSEFMAIWKCIMYCCCCCCWCITNIGWHWNEKKSNTQNTKPTFQARPKWSLKHVLAHYTTWCWSRKTGKRSP